MGGTGGGKTWFAPYWVLSRLQKPGSRLLAIGMGYQKHVERVMIHELEECFKRHEVPYSINRSVGTMTLWNGSQILFGSAENPESLEGPHLDGGVWIDEAGYMPRTAFDVAMRRTNFNNAPMLITTVPYFLNWVKTDVKDLYDAGDTAIDWIHCRSKDNLKYSREALDREYKNKRPEYIEIFYEGNFARPYGLIYPDPPDEQVLFDPEVEFPDGFPAHWPCFSGHDFGINNPNSAVWARLSDDDVLYVFGEYQAPEMTMKQHVDRWRRHGLTETDASFGDPAGADQMMTAAENDFIIQKSNNDILSGIDLVNDRFLSDRLRIARGCKQLIDYRALYTWKKAKDEENLLEEPEKPQPAEHMMDALRYLTYGIFLKYQQISDDGGSIVVVRRKTYAA